MGRGHIIYTRFLSWHNKKLFVRASSPNKIIVNRGSVWGSTLFVDLKSALFTFTSGSQCLSQALFHSTELFSTIDLSISIVDIPKMYIHLLSVIFAELITKRINSLLQIDSYHLRSMKLEFIY